MQWAILAAWAAPLVGARDAGLGSARAVRGSRLAVQGWKAAGDSWDYSARGADWAGTCSKLTNANQSPMDVSKAPESASGKFLFYRYPPLYQAVMLTLDHGMVLSANLMQTKGSMAIGPSTDSYPNLLDKQFELVHLEIHTPSEHTFGGVTVPLELQLHHRDVTNGDWAIAAIGFKAGPEPDDEVLKGLASGGLPDGEQQDTYGPADGGASVEFGALFKLPSVFLQYEGTTTTPPCTKSTSWFVRKDALQASDDVLDKFRVSVASGASVHSKESGNSRVLQPVGGRSVSAYNAVSALQQEPAQTLGLPGYLMTTTTAAAGSQVTGGDQSTADLLAAAEQKLNDAKVQLATYEAAYTKAQEDQANAGAGPTGQQAANTLAAAETDVNDQKKLVETLTQQVEGLKLQEAQETASTSTTTVAPSF